MPPVVQSLLPRVIAHRGASAVAPENTLAAIARAADLGARGVEIDVTLSADEIPVLLHDAGLDRTTSGRGPVVRHTLASLRGLDAGSWFSPDFAGEPIPTLEEAVALISARDLALNLEIKPAAGWERITAERTLEVLGRCWPREAPLVVSSQSAESLALAQAVAPAWPRGLIVEAIPAHWNERLDALGCVSLHCDYRFVTSGIADAVHAAGHGLLAFTVNDVDRARALFAAGVDAVFTDDPAAILAAVSG